MYRHGIFLSCSVLLLVTFSLAAENSTDLAPAVVAIPVAVVNVSKPVNQSGVAPADAPKPASDSPASEPLAPEAPHNSSRMAENSRMAGPPSSMAQQPSFALPVAPEPARARAPPSVVRDDPHSCYTCNSFQDTTHKCKKPDQVQKVACPGNNSGQRICHHIVGTHTNNKKVEKNIVIAGCGSAPPVNLPEIETPIHSTFNGQEIKCTPFNYEHDDQGDAKRSNQAIKFMGTSCNCEGTLCNSHSEYSRHFTNSGIATKATSFFSVLSSVFGVVLFSLALRA